MPDKKFISFNIAISFVAKAIGLATNFLLFKVLLDCVGSKEYGVWLTLSSIFTWFSFFDMGVGNGLKNKLTTAITLRDFEKAKSYVSTSYFMYTAIFSLVSLSFFVISHFIDWESVLDIQKSSYWSLSRFVSLILLLFVARFVLNLIISISTAQQISSMVDIQGFFINILVLALCIGLMTLQLCSFYSVALIHAAVPIMVLSIITLVLFRNKFKFIRPDFKSVSWQSAKELFSLGNQFLILQLGSVFLMTSASVFINWFVNSEEVVVYNAVFRYFSIISIGFQTISFPFWAAFTEAYTKGNIEWIKRSIKQLLMIWLIFLLLGLLFLLISDWVYLKWLSDKVNIPVSLSVLLMIQVLLSAFSSIFSYFCNAVGALRIQIVLSFFSLVVSVPLVYVLAVIFELKTNGVVIAFILLQLLFAVFLPFQTRQILKTHQV